MKKKVVMLLLATVCSLSMIACGTKKQNEEKDDATKTEQTDKEEKEEESGQEQEEENENQVVTAEPRVIYEEGFDTVADFAALNWQKTSYSNNTATWQIADVNGNKQLVVDNLSQPAQGATAHVLVGEDLMTDVAGGNYEVSFDLTMMESDKDSRWCALLLFSKDSNTKGDMNQTRVAFRANGNGAFETYMDGQNNGTTHKSGAWEGIVYPAFTDTVSPNRWTVNEQFNVRVVVDYDTTTVRIYINNNLSAVSALETWSAVETAAGNNSAVSLYVSDNIKIAVDNVKVTAY